MPNYVFLTQLGQCILFYVVYSFSPPPPQHLSNFWVCKKNLKTPIGPHFRLINNRRRRICPLLVDRALLAMVLISDNAPGLVLSFRCPFWAFAAFKALVETARTLGATAEAVRVLRCAHSGIILISPLPPAPDILLAWLFNFKELNLRADACTAGCQGERTQLRRDQMQCPRGRECRGKGRGHGIHRCMLIAAAAPPNPRNLFRRALYQLLDSADLKIYMHTTLQTCLVGVLRMVSHARDFNSFDFPHRL
jgi:hypothetical protein